MNNWGIETLEDLKNTMENNDYIKYDEDLYLDIMEEWEKGEYSTDTDCDILVLKGIDLITKIKSKIEYITNELIEFCGNELIELDEEEFEAESVIVKEHMYQGDYIAEANAILTYLEGFDNEDYICEWGMKLVNKLRELEEGSII